MRGCAIWDLLGKARGQSVCSLLGGRPGRSPPISSIGGYYREGKRLADIGREMESYRAAGIAGCNFKVGGLAPEADAERVRAARAAAGLDFVLAVDANRGWSVGDAVRFAQLVEPLDIRWFEEPCHWHDDARMMAVVRRQTASRSPRVSPKSPATPPAAARCKRRRPVNFDASEGESVTEWRRVVALCQAADVKITHHEEPQIAGHLLAAVPHSTYVECFADPERNPAWQALWSNRPALRDGGFPVADEPGFGLVLDQADLPVPRVRRYMGTKTPSPARWPRK